MKITMTKFELDRLVFTTLSSSLEATALSPNILEVYARNPEFIKGELAKSAIILTDKWIKANPQQVTEEH